MVVRTARQRVRHPYVTREKGICGGSPVIKGTRIRVAQIAIEYEHLGWSPDEIIRAHPHLTLAQIHDALSYYYENTEEIHAEIRRDEQVVEELKKMYSRSAIPVG
jgi:uncharacterized protein (DUF433 family)